MPKFNLKKFLVDVFGPEPRETVLVMVDLPHGDIKDSDMWKDRRDMAEEWRRAFIDLSDEYRFSVLPLLTYEATGTHGKPLPENGRLGDEEVRLSELFSKVTLVVALTEFSATGPLAGFAEYLPKFRGASIPKATRSMQDTGFAADYEVIQRRCQELKRYMEQAKGLQVEFSTGHSCYFDLRYRKPSVDDGKIDTSVWGKKGDAILNLPGGETFEVPYEGEKDGEPSVTRGELPLEIDEDKAVFVVEANKVVRIDGSGALARKWSDFIGVDSGRRNIAEVAFGCNEMADPYGPIVESEKSGFHWAIGESTHLGGVFGEDSFDNPANACHQDFIYAGHNNVMITKADLVDESGKHTTVIKNGKYII